MKVVILAGGLGSRLSEETTLKPKPMVEIGEKPILWHIMKIYSHYGFNEFVILCGYKGYLIKEYFTNYYLHTSDVYVDLENNKTGFINNNAEPWKVHLIDTGNETMTGGRIKRVKDIIGDEDFMLTYGDGVANINIDELIKFHKSHNKLITMTASQPEGRFGAINLQDETGLVREFLEKPKGDGDWVNAGFFVCNSKVIEYIDGDSTIWERGPLEQLAKENQLYVYKHSNFWHPMDTLRDRNELNEMYINGDAPWKIWK